MEVGGIFPNEKNEVRVVKPNLESRHYHLVVSLINLQHNLVETFHIIS